MVLNRLVGYLLIFRPGPRALGVSEGGNGAKQHFGGRAPSTGVHTQSCGCKLFAFVLGEHGGHGLVVAPCSTALNHVPLFGLGGRLPGRLTG